MTTNILLSSEAFVKAETNISDNLAGKYVLPALREAQEIKLRGVLGDTLLARLKELVREKRIDDPEFEQYKTLIEVAQYYLAYSAVVEVATRVSYKISNFGVARTADENMQVASQDEIAKTQAFYQSKADAYCIHLQSYLLEHRTSFPELSENTCYKIKSNLRSAASCGIFLGGARGKSARRDECGGGGKR